MEANGDGGNGLPPTDELGSDHHSLNDIAKGSSLRLDGKGEFSAVPGLDHDFQLFGEEEAQ
jgi:hypothetical protein